MKLDYFYGAQMERVMKHLIRIFNNFKVKEGYDSKGNEIFRVVPCRYGDISRMVATNIKEGSENVMPSAPFMTINYTGMELSKNDIRSPMSEQLAVGLNKPDGNGNYTEQVEGYYEVERYNPVPWKITFDVDVFVTNAINKMELFEQIAVLFAPSIPIQLSTNPNDWTSYSYVELTGFNFNSNRGFPQGSQYNLDMCKFTFETMVWLSLPAKVNRAVLINQIVTNIRAGTLDDFNIPNLTDMPTLSYDVYSPGNHSIAVKPTAKFNEYVVTLLGKYGADKVQGMVYDWKKLFQYYTDAKMSTSRITLLEAIEGSPSMIHGTITPSAVPNEALVVIDTATLPPTNAEPFMKFIDFNKGIENLADGRYIVLAGYEEMTIQGQKFTIGDILEHLSGIFVVKHPAENEVRADLSTGKRYKYNKGIGWHELVSTKYQPGFWRLGFPI